MEFDTPVKGYFTKVSKTKYFLWALSRGRLLESLSRVARGRFSHWFEVKGDRELNIWDTIWEATLTYDPNPPWDAFFRPFAAGYSRCAMSKGCNPVGILFALADKDGGVRIFHQFEPAVYDAALAKLPNPSAVSIRPSVPKCLGLESQHLVQQDTVRIGIIISRGGYGPRLLLLRENRLAQEICNFTVGTMPVIVRFERW